MCIDLRDENASQWLLYLHSLMHAGILALFAADHKPKPICSVIHMKLEMVSPERHELGFDSALDTKFIRYLLPHLLEAFNTMSVHCPCRSFLFPGFL